jgi:hypothetical protein
MAADDRLSGARNLGTLNGVRTFRDSVGLKDKNDHYTFTLNGRSRFNLLLSKLQNNVDVSLIQGRKVLLNSKKVGKRSGAIAATLEAGTYYLRVYTKGRGSRYQLKLNATPTLTSLEGSSVNFGVYWPTTTNPGSRLVNATVGSGIEFPSIANLALQPDFFRVINTNVDISANQIIINYLEGGTIVTSPGQFNGYIFNFFGNNTPSIIGASIDPSSTVPSTAIDLSFDRDSVFVSAPNLTVNPGSWGVINLQFAPIS